MDAVADFADLVDEDFDDSVDLNMGDFADSDSDLFAENCSSAETVGSDSVGFGMGDFLESIWVLLHFVDHLVQLRRRQMPDLDKAQCPAGSFEAALGTC